MAELCAKILHIMHTAFEDYVPSFCQLYTNSACIRFYCLFWDFLIEISTYILFHTRESNYSPKINENQQARVTNVMQQFWILLIQIPISKLVQQRQPWGMNWLMYAKAPFTDEMSYAEFVWLHGIWQIMRKVANYAQNYMHA